LQTGESFARWVRDASPSLPVCQSKLHANSQSTSAKRRLPFFHSNSRKGANAGWVTYVSMRIVVSGFTFYGTKC
jgi:hypothetical protein